MLAQNQDLPAGAKEVRIIRTIGPRNTILDYNPVEETPTELSLWLWRQKWIEELDWDPKDWSWRRIGILPESSCLNYTTKRGYRIALRQDNHQMPLDAELETTGIDSKTRAKFFNRLWHPHLPRKVSAHQWLILTEGLPVGAWREKIGQDGACLICEPQDRETLVHAFMECDAIKLAWTLFRRIRSKSGQQEAYTTWKEISRGLLSTPSGPSVDTDLQWDTAAAYTINSETPWDTLRAQLLWAIWCQRVSHAFNDERFHLGMVLSHAWKNTIYCAMEAYKELHRHKRNEEKRQELISCFQKIWTANSIFGRLTNSDIKWHLIPPPEFLPQELGAWMAPPIRIIRRSPSPDSEAEFAAQQDFPERVQEFIDEIGRNVPLNNEDNHLEAQQAPLMPTEQAPAQSPPSLRADTQPLEPECSNLEATRAPLTTFNGDRSTLRPEAHHTTPSGIENQPPSTNAPRQPSIGRPKVRCTFGPKRRADKANTSRGPAEDELADLLQEIDNFRYQDTDTSRASDLSPSSHHPPGSAAAPLNAQTGNPYQLQEHKIKSRPKIKCRFGPYKGHPVPRLDRHPSPAPTQTPEASLPTRYDIRNLSPDNPFLITDHLGVTRIGPDRVTFCHPGPRGGPPFSRYFPTARELPRPNPNRFALARLGVSNEELEARVVREIDEELRVIMAERRLAHITSFDFPRILSKEDCLVLFEATGVPTSGSLLGVYKWATDAETSVDPEEIDALLNASSSPLPSSSA